MPIAFTTSRRVEFADTDMAGLIHFVTFYRMMESAEHEFLRSLGTSVVMRDDDGATIGWPRKSAECDFHAPAFFEDELDLLISVAKIGRSSLTLAYEIRRGEMRIATGRMTTVCCQVERGGKLSTTEIPDELRVKLNELLDVE